MDKHGIQLQMKEDKTGRNKQDLRRSKRINKAMATGNKGDKQGIGDGDGNGKKRIDIANMEGWGWMRINKDAAMAAGIDGDKKGTVTIQCLANC